jgi:hypothetical protein
MQLWYEGLSAISENKILHGSNVETICDMALENHFKKNPQFKQFWDGNINEKYHSKMYADLVPVILPVNENFHLAFFLNYNVNGSKGFGDKCTIFNHPIKELDNFVYPYVQLRINYYDLKIKELPRTAIINGIEHDIFNSLTTNIRPDLIEESYSAYNYVIDCSQVKKK